MLFCYPLHTKHRRVCITMVKTTNPKYSVQTPEGKPLVNLLWEFFNITPAERQLPANKEK